MSRSPEPSSSRFPFDVPAGFSVYKRGGAGKRSRWEVAFYVGGKRFIKRWSRSAEETIRRIRQLAPMGEIDPRTARYLLEEDRPLNKHLDEHRQSMLDEGCTIKQADQVRFRAARVFGAYGAGRLSEIVASQTMAKIASLTDLRPTKKKPRTVKKVVGERDGGDVPPPAPRALAPQSRNHYLRAVKQFTAWLERDKRIAPGSDPLKHLSGWNVKTDQRRLRQDLGDVGLMYLFKAARIGPTVCGIPGVDREMLYKLAAHSGLRPGNEIRNLTPRRCELDAEHPVLRVMAAYSKHRREDVQPIPPWFAAELKKYLKGKSGGVDEPIWNLPDEAVDLIQPDLEKARELWIHDAPPSPGDREREKRAESDFLVYQDREGRYADFYALRHTYICGLVKLGLNPKECQLLARHASITTTMDYYAHLRLTDLARAAAGIVNPAQRTPTQEQAKATGTYGTSENSAQRNLQRARGEPCLSVSTQSQKRKDSPGSDIEDKSSIDKEKGMRSETHLEGLEPSTFGSVDRRIENVSGDLTEVTGAAKRRRSAIYSAQTDEENLADTMAKISRLILGQTN